MNSHRMEGMVSFPKYVIFEDLGIILMATQIPILSFLGNAFVNRYFDCNVVVIAELQNYLYSFKTNRSGSSR